jgi:micrococcal nuclease
MNIIKKIILLLMILLLSACNDQIIDKNIVSLNYCVDGDTADFNYQNNDYRFRFIGIDSPELVNNEPYSKLAANYSCELLVKANKIEVEFDENCDIEDKYGRKLAWVFVDDELLQSKILKKGYAVVAYLYDDYKYTNDLYESENIAKSLKLGLWQ